MKILFDECSYGCVAVMTPYLKQIDEIVQLSLKKEDRMAEIQQICKRNCLEYLGRSKYYPIIAKTSKEMLEEFPDAVETILVDNFGGSINFRFWEEKLKQ